MVGKPLLILAICAVASPVYSEGGIFGAGSRSNLSSRDRDLIRAPVAGSLEGVPREPKHEVEESSIGVALDVYDPATYGGGVTPRGPLEVMARDAALRHGIPADLFFKMIKQESNWNVNALSHKGAIGLAQLMPGTARALGVNPHDPQQNLEGGARYLSTQYRKFRSWRLALAAYNAGPQAVSKYNGVPPYRETQNYVVSILGN